MRGWPTLLLILLLGETSSHRPDVRANRPALKRDRSRAYGEGELRIRDRNSLAEQLAAARQRIAELEDVEVGPVRGVSVSVGVAGLTPGERPEALLGRRRAGAQGGAGRRRQSGCSSTPTSSRRWSAVCSVAARRAWRLFRGAGTALKRLRRPRARARRRAAP